MCKTYRNRNKYSIGNPTTTWGKLHLTSHKKHKDVEVNEGNILEVQKQTSYLQVATKNGRRDMVLQQLEDSREKASGFESDPQ